MRNHLTFPRVSAAMTLCMVMLTGCQSDNLFQAENMPKQLRLMAQSNPQEVDLSRLATASGGSDTIGPGDVLELTISASLSKDDQVMIPVRIADDGTATVPDIGRVHLSGFEPQAAESLIRLEAINRGLYRNPTVTVAFAHKKTNRVRVLGAVNMPGTYELPPEASDVVSAIAAAEGLAENAGENVEIRNPVGTDGSKSGSGAPFTTVSDSEPVQDGMRSYTVNLISASKSVGNRYTVSDGGVVMVEKRDPNPIQVVGLVNDPGYYDFPIGKPLTVLGAIAMADGVSNQVADKVYVIRPVTAGRDPAVIQVSLRKAKKSGRSNIILGPGDIISVEQTPATVLLEAMQLIRFGISGTAGLF